MDTSHDDVSAKSSGGFAEAAGGSAGSLLTSNNPEDLEDDTLVEVIPGISRSSYTVVDLFSLDDDDYPDFSAFDAIKSEPVDDSYETGIESKDRDTSKGTSLNYISEVHTISTSEFINKPCGAIDSATGMVSVDTVTVSDNTVTVTSPSTDSSAIVTVASSVPEILSPTTPVLYTPSPAVNLEVLPMIPIPYTPTPQITPKPTDPATESSTVLSSSMISPIVSPTTPVFYTPSPRLNSEDLSTTSVPYTSTQHVKLGSAPYPTVSSNGLSVPEIASSITSAYNTVSPGQQLESRPSLIAPQSYDTSPAFGTDSRPFPTMKLSRIPSPSNKIIIVPKSCVSSLGISSSSTPTSILEGPYNVTNLATRSKTRAVQLKAAKDLQEEIVDNNEAANSPFIIGVNRSPPPLTRGKPALPSILRRGSLHRTPNMTRASLTSRKLKNSVVITSRGITRPTQHAVNTTSTSSVFKECDLPNEFTRKLLDNSRITVTKSLSYIDNNPRKWEESKNATSRIPDTVTISNKTPACRLGKKNDAALELCVLDVRSLSQESDQENQEYLNSSELQDESSSYSPEPEPAFSNLSTEMYGENPVNALSRQPEIVVPDKDINSVPTRRFSLTNYTTESFDRIRGDSFDNDRDDFKIKIEKEVITIKDEVEDDPLSTDGLGEQMETDDIEGGLESTGIKFEDTAAGIVDTWL